MSAFLRSRFALPIALAAVCCCYIVLAGLFAATHSVWSPDCGARLVQVESINAHFPRLDIAYPAESLDPNGANSPLSFFAYRHANHTYVFYSVFFAILVAPLYRAFGFFGLAIPALLGGLWSVYLTHRIGTCMGLKFPVAAALITGFCTPILLYSIVFWDHALLTALGLCALLIGLTATERQRPLLWLWAGIVLGAGVWLHEILLPFAPAFLAMQWSARKRITFLPCAAFLLVGLAALLIPLAIANTLLYGTPLGAHLSNNRLGSTASITGFLLTPQEWIPGALYTLFAWGNTNPGFTWQLREWLQKPPQNFPFEITASLWLALPLFCWVVTNRIHRRFPSLWPFAILSLLAMAASGLWVLWHEEWPHSPFLACPFLVVAFAAPLVLICPSEEFPPAISQTNPVDFGLMRRMVAIAAAVYLLANLLKPTLGGTEWGSRHLLGIVPCAVLLSGCAIENWLFDSESRRRTANRSFVGASLLLVALSFAITLHGTRIVYQMHTRNRALADAVAALPNEPILTSVWWMMPNAAPAYPLRRVIFGGDLEHTPNPVLARLRQARIPTFTLVGFANEQGTTNDLLIFAREYGYVPISQTDISLPMGLASRRYLLVNPLESNPQ